MARVTVENCVLVMPNRFALIALTAKRARDIEAGAQPLVEKNKDKNAVTALREVEQGKIDPSKLLESYIQSFQKNFKSDEPDQDEFFIKDSPEEMSEELSASDLRDVHVMEDEEFDADFHADNLDLDE